MKNDLWAPATAVAGALQYHYETYLPEGMKGVVVISHGFTEASVRFHEVIWYLLEAGYGAAVDHRGHGYSARDVEDANIVHIDRFDRYVEDLYSFVDQVVKPAVHGLPLYLYGHSPCQGALVSRSRYVYPLTLSHLTGGIKGGLTGSTHE